MGNVSHPIPQLKRALSVRIVSYNLRKNAAGNELERIAIDHDIDVMCVQECDSTTLPERLHQLTLAGNTHANRLGLAVYVRDDLYEILDTQVFALKRSLHDFFLAPAHERLLAVIVRDRDTGEQVTLGSFHAAPLTATNSLRRKQITAAHENLRQLSPGTPVIMVGDYNYPWFIQGLERHVTETGYALTRAKEPTYLRYKFFQGSFDFVTSQGFSVDQVNVLPAGASDHRAICLDAQRAA